MPLSWLTFIYAVTILKVELFKSATTVFNLKSYVTLNITAELIVLKVCNSASSCSRTFYMECRCTYILRSVVFCLLRMHSCVRHFIVYSLYNLSYIAGKVYVVLT